MQTWLAAQARKALRTTSVTLCEVHALSAHTAAFPDGLVVVSSSDLTVMGSMQP